MRAVSSLIEDVAEARRGVRRNAMRALIAAVLPFTTACSSIMRSPAAPAAVPPVMRIYDTKTQRDVSFNDLMAAVARADMVFFGEQHDDPATHAAELAVLAGIGQMQRPVVLSLEMFERDVQATLDNYLASRISEKDFLAASRPWDRYAADYRPLVELSRIRGWPVIASNIPRRLASGVSRRGLAHFDSIATADRPFIAADNRCPRDDYYAKFVGVMGGAASHGGAAPTDSATARASVDRFYEAQCVKDEAMGESIARAMAKAGSRAILLHVNGAFHSDYRLGTVDRAQRRRPEAKSLVITAVPVPDPVTGNPAAHAGKADYLIFTRVVK
jgi:uncharacterized iron-regulated protein